jgi:anti-sigma B factor antagonist
LSTQSSIRVGVSEGVVWVRVDGKGNFQNSSSLKEFAKGMLERGHRRFIFDLMGCPMMDSTFMGTLAGIALKVHGRDGSDGGEAGVCVINLNERTRSLLCNLGLDQLLALQAEGSAQVPCTQATESLGEDPGDRRMQAETMLEAHQAVVDANPINEAKFKDVLEYLRQDLASDS